ncbi:MAG: hypothetical protein IJT97_09475 [Bacteroidaceae bacterium]|nr:hypothetical protein [Bacteroidaceae bacterium]
MGKFQIVWRAKAKRQYIQLLIYAQQEYGSKTFYRWVESIREMEDRLRENPKSYTRVLELANEPREYRGHIVMRNFKIIYTFDEKLHQVTIVTIWDMRMNPTKLRRGIRCI